MLRLLQIRNYAIIEELEIEFGTGLNVLTGETGAGKSILVGALGLALGDRADQRAVRQGAGKAEISVLFECPPGHKALQWLLDHELDDDHNCSLRRVVSAEGRSRAFVNNAPVTLQNLRELGATLIEIHGQQAHQALMHTGEQRRLLDAIAGNTELAKQVAAAWTHWQNAIEAHADFARAQDERLANLELQKFQLTELEQLALQEGDVERLVTEHHRLANIETISQAAQTAFDAVYNGEPSAQDLVTRAIEALESLTHEEAARPVAEQLRSVEIELRDAGMSLSHYCDALEPDPARLAELDSRLGRIRTLARRHHVDDGHLWRKTAELRSAVESLDDAQTSESALAERAAAAREAYMQGAEKLSKARKRHAKQLEREVSDHLPRLGLRDAAFRIAVAPRAQPDSTGTDAIEYEVRLNTGQGFSPLARVASGGELARISLALQVASGGRSAVPTFVFDEIDTGIGGSAAEIVGLRLRELAAQQQVLCVTHQAQVASQGHVHFRIEKSDSGEGTRTSVERLSQEDRVTELSRMIGGLEITEKARAHAAEMMTRAAAGS